MSNTHTTQTNLNRMTELLLDAALELVIAAEEAADEACAAEDNCFEMGDDGDADHVAGLQRDTIAATEYAELMTIAYNNLRNMGAGTTGVGVQ